MKRSRLLVSILFAVGLAVLGTTLAIVPGCSSSKSDTPKMKVAIFTWVGYAPIHLAKNKNFFEGIDVEIIKIDDTAARRSALTAGSVDASVDIVDSFTSARATGLPASVVLKLDDSMGGDGIVAKKDIKSIKDLRGHTIAFAKDQPSHFFLVALLDREGMTMKDVIAKEVNDADVAGNAFVSGSVDAAVTWEPFLTKASQQPNGRILTTSRETPGLIVDVFTVRDDYLNANPAHVTAFIKGWYRALEFHKQNPDEANQIMADAMQLGKQEFVEMIGGIKYSGPPENKLFFTKAANGESPFTQLVGKASSVWQREGVSKGPVDPKSVDGSNLVLSIP